MLFIISLLNPSSAVGFVNRSAHRAGHHIGIHRYVSFGMARRSPHSLNERGVRTQESLLVGIEDGDKAHLRQVQSLSQEVDPHNHIIDTETQVPENLHPFQGVNL